MNEQRIETNESPHIMIPACTGQVVVKSWLQTAVSIQGASFTVEQDSAIHITSQGDLFLAVPEQTSVSLGVIGGDVTLKHLAGGMTGDNLQGNVVLNNLDAVQIDQVGQALTAENLNGTLTVKQVGGAVSLQRVSEIMLGSVKGSAVIEYANGPVELHRLEGSLSLKSINGDVMVANALSDVVLQNLGGSNTFPSVNGDIWLVGGLRAGEQLFVSERTVYVYWPDDAPLHLFANAPQIDNFVPLENENRREEGDQIILTGHIEEGKTSLTLKSAQRIAMKPLGSAEPQFLPDEFMVPEEPAGDLAQKVRTAVHAVLTESAEMVGLEERLVTAVVAALAEMGETAVPSEPSANLYIVESTESRTHILELVRDGLISIKQADVLLEALT
ncbi:MAG: hypothetical protein IAF02_17300 [Anaerolineae bacterium]|nr:hypothetical protein [Anaerolineae bacterium]